MRRGIFGRGVTAALGLALAAAAAACGSTASSTASSTVGSGGAVDHPVGSTPGAWNKERFREALAQHGGTARPARSTVENSRIGAIFDSDVSGSHFCTSSVVTSTAKDVLVTAAHCVHGGKGGGYKGDLVFVPDYSNGSAPSGQWPITHIVVDQRWIDSSDPDLDVAFLTVGKVGGEDIQDVLGGNALGIDMGFDRPVKITGYPSSAGAAISCFNRTTRQSAYQMRIACTGFPGGTSGSPWLTAFDPKTRCGTVVGVIGGYQEGGDTADVSYSVYFDQDVKHLYDRAVAAG